MMQTTDDDGNRYWRLVWPKNDKHPDGMDLAGKEVIFLEPDPDLLDMAFELASDQEHRGEMVYNHQATMSQLKLCLKKVGDTRYTYEDLQAGGLTREFTEYQRSMLVQALQQITTPEEAKVDNFLSSASRVDAEDFEAQELEAEPDVEAETAPESAGAAQDAPTGGQATVSG